MKRRIIGILILTFLSVFVHYQITYAADTYKVSADNSSIKIFEENKYLIPINLYNNNGIMGFRIKLNYDNKKAKIISLSRGLITSKGNFATNITDADGVADIIWNDTEDVKIENGSLLYIIVQKLSDSIKIDLSFSQADTFNEQYMDVVLSCDNIEINEEVFAKVTEDILVTLEEEEQNNDSSDYSSSNFAGEDEAEKNALKDYIQNKKENTLSESEDKLNEKVVSHLKGNEYEIITDKEYNLDENDNLWSLKNIVVIILVTIILIIIFICHKKYVTKNREDQDEKKN